MHSGTLDVSSELRRLNWALRAYARASSALVRFDKFGDIGTDICEAIVADHAYALAWVGLVEPSSERPIRLVASAGHAAGYLENLELFAAGDRPEAQGPAGTSIRDGKPHILYDAATDPNYLPWRARAAQFGLRSNLTVPLKTEGKTIGCLAVYAVEPEAFGAEEVSAFETMANDLAFAIAAAQNRERLIAAEARTRVAEARFKSYFQNTPIATLVADRQGVFVDANPAAQSLFGYASEQFCTLRLADLHPPEDADLVASAVTTLLRDGYLHGRYRAKRADGTVFAALVTCASMPDGWQIGYFQDIEALEQANARALAMEARFRTYFENLPLAMLVADSGGRIVDANPAAEKMWGYSAEEFRARTVPDLHAADDAERAAEGFAATQRTGKAVREHRLLRADGTTLAALVTGTALPDGRFLGFFEDIDARKRTEAQLLQAQRLAALGEMMAGMAHELNQPLTAISMTAENAMFALEGPRGTVRLAEKLQSIVDQVMRAAEIVRNARRFGRADTGRVEPTPVKAAVGGALSLVQNRLLEDSVSVRRSFAEGLPDALVSRVQLEQVLTNLLLNACDAYAERPEQAEREIEIVAGGNSAEVSLTIADHAGGIPPAILPRVFEPFFTTKNHTKGTGLGLSISYGIITGAGGSLTAANRDGGAVFELRLPAAPAHGS